MAGALTQMTKSCMPTNFIFLKRHVSVGGVEVRDVGDSCA